MLMNIEALEFLTYESPLQSKTLRPRFTTYLQDLYKQTNDELDFNSLNEGDQASYLEVVTPLLDKLAAEQRLDNVDLLCLVNWSPEIDPDHSSYGPYLIERWLPQAKLYNVADQGLMSLFTALKIIYHLDEKQCRNCLLLMPEQNTFPLPRQAKTLLKPRVSGAVALKLSHSPSVCGWRIIQTSVSEIIKSENNNPGFIPFFKEVKQAMDDEAETLQFTLNDIESHCQGRVSLSKEIE